MPIRPEKLLALKERMAKLAIEEKDLDERFIQGGGKGGQKVNKTASCVYLKHLPTGIEVKCQKERSREMNRFFARRELCDAYEVKILGKKSQKQLDQEKKQKQKKRRARRRGACEQSSKQSENQDSG